MQLSFGPLCATAVPSVQMSPSHLRTHTALYAVLYAVLQVLILCCMKQHAAADIPDIIILVSRRIVSPARYRSPPGRGIVCVHNQTTKLYPCHRPIDPSAHRRCKQTASAQTHYIQCCNPVLRVDAYVTEYPAAMLNSHRANGLALCAVPDICASL